MNWARAKTILIAILLAIDIFLLVVYINRDNDVRLDEMAVRTEVCRILASQGIEVEESLIPLDSVNIRPAILREAENKEKAARRLFGEISSEETSGSLAFSGDGGNIMFTNDVFSLVYESGESVESREDAENLARKIASKLLISTDSKNFSSQTSDGGYTVKVPQVFSAVPVFNCGTEFKISASGSVIASGKFIGKGSLAFSQGEVISTSALMLSFADGIKAEGLFPLKVSDITLGYTAKTPAAGRVGLSPTMELVTEKGTFYVDMQTGELIKL